MKAILELKNLFVFFKGINSNSNNVVSSSPLFIQQLQQLSEISAAATGSNGFMPPNNQINFSTANLANVSWNTAQTSAWFEQAKMAAMLPMYNVFQNVSWYFLINKKFTAFAYGFFSKLKLCKNFNPEFFFLNEKTDNSYFLCVYDFSKHLKKKFYIISDI